MKRIMAVVLVAVLIVCHIPQNVFADTPVVTVDNTIGDLLVGYSGNDILTESNYLNNYDEVSGYLKYCAKSSIYAYNGNSDFGGNFENVIKGFIDNNTQEFMSIPFPDINGYKFMYFNYWRGDWSPHLGCSVVVTEGNLYNVEGVLISDQPMYIYTNWTVFTNGGNNIGTTDLNDGTPNVTIDTKSSAYLPDYYVYDAMNTDIHYTNPTMWIYSDVPFYMIAYKNSQYTDGDYLVDTYNYDGIAQVFNSIGSDTTGFVIDRRTEHMIEDTSGNVDSGQIVSVDYDENLFEGVLGFNWFNPSATLNYNNHTQLYYPYFIFNYQINNYTNIHKTSCSIVIESSIGLCLRYNLDGSPYQTISHFSNNQTLLLTDNIDKFIIYGSDQGSNTWINTSLRSTRGFGTATGLDPFEGDLTDDIKTALSQYGTNGNIDYAQSYALFKVNFYIKDNVTGDISETYQAQFDLYNNKYSDNKEKLISNDNKEFIDFKNSFDYQQNGNDLTPVNYANDVSGGQGGNSIVSITNPQFPYLLVDIPEGEWMSKTPNLTTILTDFKDALSEVKDNSILNVMSETYNYLPAPVWQYFTYGVGILIAIGIWRAITRR